MAHRKVLPRPAAGFLMVLMLAGIVSGQAPAPAPAPPPPVNESDDPLLKPFRWRSIGPASMGGRIDDIAVVESNTNIIYVGFATAGIWKSVNNGTTWTPIFDTYDVSSIGDIAVFQPNPDIVWVGTGEPNNRQSSSFGDGVYKSTDGGKTFTNVGLKDSQTISRIVTDTKDPDVAYVAALGHLFGANPERGIFKTTDGGKTWTRVHFIDEDTGITDMVMDPSDNRVLYAASYQRRRTPWGFNGGGPGSAIWKTVDSGKTWTKLAGGLPEGDLGRIGLDVSRSNPSVVYAQIENDNRPQMGMGGMAAAMGMGGQGQQEQRPPDPKRNGVWRSDDKGKTWRIVSNNNNRPMYYSKIRVDPTNPEIVYTGGAPFFKSTDGGKTFRAVPGIAHSDHHAIWINPKNGNHLLLGNDGGLNVTWDQCENWEFINTIAASQFYAVTADMRKPYYVYGGLQDNGSWGGPSATRNSLGITNADWFRIGGGDGFYVQVDPTDHNTIYVESQNGAVQRLDLRTGRSVSIRPRAATPPRGTRAGSGGGQDSSEPSPEQTPAGGAQQAASAGVQQPQAPAGVPPTVDPQQFAAFFRGQPLKSNIVPEPPVGEQYRFNWNTPIHLSPHNPRTVYVGANKLFKSVDRGETWTGSQDLTKQVDRNTLAIMGVPGDKPMFSKNDGASNYGNITTVAESPILPGLLWVGTDDGNVQLSRDGGATWTNVADNIPGGPWTHQISRVEPSRFDAGACYVAIDGHRGNDHKPYVFVTGDYGKSWKSISSNLPTGNVNVIREDPRNRNLLYLGTEYALYVSLNGGAEWKRFMTGLPTVRIDDILVHPRDNDLIVGTHGRGIYIIDDITPLQQLNDKALEADAHLFEVRPGTQWLQDVTLSRYMGGAKNFIGENPAAGTAISYHLKSDAGNEVKITISDIDGKVVRNLTGPKTAGLHRVQWNLRGDPPPRPQGMPAGFGGGAGFGRFGGPALDPGTYFVKLVVDGKEHAGRVKIEEDPGR